jgi:hypothetical protein
MESNLNKLALWNINNLSLEHASDCVSFCITKKIARVMQTLQLGKPEEREEKSRVKSTQAVGKGN